jgi:hypothetical protein
MTEARLERRVAGRRGDIGARSVILKPKAPESGLEVIGGLSDAGKVREQAEGAF